MSEDKALTLGGGVLGGLQVRQSTCFALATSAFDAECRTEIRMKEGLRALSNCLNSEESRVQVTLQPA